MILGILLLGLIGVLAHCYLIEMQSVEFTRHEVRIRGLPASFDGFTIVQLSDVHMGPTTRAPLIRSVVRKVNALDPDLVALTGDYVNRLGGNVGPVGRILSELKAKHGVYAVLGNHDYWVNAPAVTRSLRRGGIDVLFDEQRTITIGKDAIRLVGIDDVWEGEPDYDKALAGVTDEEVCIALSHNPDALLSLRGRPVDLVFAGHTHGGQIWIPGIGPVYGFTKLGRKHLAGLTTYEGIRLYVSRGLGCLSPRFRCRPEVPTLVLRCGD